MSTVLQKIEYPTSDGRPMAETDLHRAVGVDAIALLERLYVQDLHIYVSENLLLFYDEGNKRSHISPDVFVVKGVAKRRRDNYLIWEEGKGPDFVIEITSKTTKNEDIRKKFRLYQNVLCVSEYFLFDPLGDYLKPPLRGYRLVGGVYQAIELVEGRLPSEVVGLHLEAGSERLDFYDPIIQEYRKTPVVEAEARLQIEQAAKLMERDARLRERDARREAERKAQRAEDDAIQAREEFLAERALNERTQVEMAALLAELARLRGSSSQE